MFLLNDDPIIRSMEATGYPPWIDADFEEIGDDEDEADEWDDGIY